MHSRWAILGRAPVVEPASPASSEALLPPPAPRDPPDQSSTLSPIQFPPLSASTPKLSRSARRNLSPTTDVIMTQSSPGSSEKQIIFFAGSQPQSGSVNTILSTGNPNSVSALGAVLSVSDSSGSRITLESSKEVETFPVLPPKPSSPLFTNGASSAITSKGVSIPTTNTQPSAAPPPPLAPNPPPPLTHSSPAPHTHPSPSGPTLAEQLRIKSDKSLSRLAPISIAENGRPRVMIQDSVFQKGAELHKDFIVCYFNGRSSPFNQIQSVFNHMLLASS
ncbi:hypothetical protein DY000_02062903 [Brassica cretica]|uniref:Uncharacterized protein n=1 Tax=Brassica cretica TaxID=69181 RepID=A0ABQ7AU34_BRACR|nr:hypothetical protein DY000_02062903 [Brassica cretica]